MLGILCSEYVSGGGLSGPYGHDVTVRKYGSREGHFGGAYPHRLVWKKMEKSL